MKKNILICLLYRMDSKIQMMPTGATYVSASLKRESYNVHNFVWDTSKDSNKITNIMNQFNIDVVMCGGTVYDSSVINQIFTTAKEAVPNVLTISGGPLMCYSPEEAMELMPQCDIGVIGEAEITACNLMESIEANKPLDTVNNIVYKNSSNELKFTEQCDNKPDLATIPMPDIESFFGDWLMNSNCYSVSAGRGCSSLCTFCTKMSHYRERPLEKLFEELDYYVPKYKLKKIWFVNEYFNTEESYLDAFCEKMKSYGVSIFYLTRISPNLTVDVLKKLKNAGVDDIQFGLESADDTVLRSMRKGVTSKLMLDVLKNVKAARINVSGSFVFGDPAETKETLNNTLDFIKANRDLFYGIGFNMLLLWPGSYLYKKAVSDGILDPIQHIKNGCPPINISQLTDDEYVHYRDYGFANFFSTVFNTDFNIKDVTVQGTTLTLKCSICNKQHICEIKPKEMQPFPYKFFCSCGEQLSVDYISHLFNKAKASEIVKNYNTAFYGIGALFQKIYSTCNFGESNLYFLNSSVENLSTQSDLKIHPPKAIKDFGIEKVIVTISGSFDADAIISDLREKYPQTEFMMWYEVGEVMTSGASDR